MRGPQSENCYYSICKSELLSTLQPDTSAATEWRITQYSQHSTVIPLKRKKLLPFSIKTVSWRVNLFSIKLLFCVIYSWYSAFAKRLRRRNIQRYILTLEACERERQGNVRCATERPLYASNATVYFRIQHIFLSGDFTFLIYCVLLIEDNCLRKNQTINFP